MNVLYLIKILNTNELSEVVANIDLPPLDANLALWDALEAGEIEINEDENTITALKDAEPTSDPDLKSKLVRVIQHYAKQEANITRGRLNAYVKDPVTGQGYPWHDYIMAVQHLIDDGTIVENVVEVREEKKRFTDKKGRKKEKVIRPAHKFAFLGLPENDNEEWNARAVNKWIDDFSKVK